MSTETTNKKIKIDNGTTFGRTYTDKAIDAKLPTDLIASANKLSLGVGNAPLGNGVNLDGFTYDEATKTLKASGGEGGISVIELTDKNGTIASTQLSEINANPQNFAFKYNGKILLFTKADSTTYQYCNNTTNSSDNNVMTTSTLLTITSSTGVYTIAENVHNVVANSIHPANGGDLTNIQVGSKVYSIPSGGGGKILKKYYLFADPTYIPSGTYKAGDVININVNYSGSEVTKLPAGYPFMFFSYGDSFKMTDTPSDNDPFFICTGPYFYTPDATLPSATFCVICIRGGTVPFNNNDPKWKLKADLNVIYQE